MNAFGKILGCTAVIAIAAALFLYETPRIERIGR